MKKRLRIIVAEDDALIAMDLGELLEGMGHDVCATVRTEAEAVEAAARLEPDLMIVDGNLDHGSGVSAMRTILAHSFVAHVYVTGDPQHIEGLTSDAIIVAKPFNLRELTAGIERARKMPKFALKARDAARIAE